MERHLWWQKGIIYQVYPASFMDTNGDGYGDLPGILSRLDYLQWLGIDAVWISPIYPSPMVGSRVRHQRLQGHSSAVRVDGGFRPAARGVPRTGDEGDPRFRPEPHLGSAPLVSAIPLFRDNPKRDWYIWKSPGPGGGPPNNWLSTFGEDAWEFDQATGQYYYHAFFRQQPDLNWRNPEVQEAMLSVMRFWLDKGVDGFRVDVMWHLMKDQHFRDNPPNPDYRRGCCLRKKLVEVYSADQPEVQDIVAMMRAVIDDFDERLLIGEVYLPVDELMDYYGARRASAPICRTISSLSCCRGRRWTSTWRSTSTKARCPSLPGRTGCWATTTRTASPRGSASNRPAWRRCCC